nr:protein FAR1-related sequence 5-like [Tanacetum cinerariifolium]
VEDLKRGVSRDEIRDAVWSCGDSKSPGPDGYTFEFFKNLIGCVYKVVTKIMASRLASVISDIISDTQSAFVSERQILDGPFIINEILRWCKRKNKQAMFFKVDFAKAHDSVRWDFLIDVLEAFGFGSKCRVVDVGMFKGIRLSSSLSISHLFYTDDALIIGEWSNENLHIIIHVLKCFYLVSGLQINIHKSQLLGVGVPLNDVEVAASSIGCSIMNDQFRYLGVMVGENMSRHKSWSDVTLKLRSRLSKWKSKTLSIGGILKEMKSIRNSFFIGADPSEKKITWVAWNKVLASKKNEDTSHVLFQCELAQSVLRYICRWWDLEWQCWSSFTEWNAWFLALRLSLNRKGLLEGVFSVACLLPATSTTSNLPPATSTITNLPLATSTTSNLPPVTSTTSNLPPATSFTSQLPPATSTTSNLPPATSFTSQLPPATSTTSNLPPATFLTSQLPSATSLTSHLLPSISTARTCNINEADLFVVLVIGEENLLIEAEIEELDDVTMNEEVEGNVNLEPGKRFDTLEECVEFYSVYAEKGGFEVKKSTQKKTKSGLVKSKYDMVFVPFTGIDNHLKCVNFGSGMLLKEDTEAYTWLLKSFMTAHEKQPTMVVTDQDGAMKKEIEAVLTESKHRLCMWHIMQKVPAKICPEIYDETDFKERFGKLVWNMFMEPLEFEEKWSKLVEDFGLQNHKWMRKMFDLRHM